MIKLIPYSIYELAAMDRFLSRMARQNWEYCWRFLCFIRFKRTSNPRAIKWVEIIGQQLRMKNSLPRALRTSQDSDPIMDNSITTGYSEFDVLYKPLRNETAIQSIINLCVLCAVCCFTIFACFFSNWDSINVLWGMREVASLFFLPLIPFLLTNQIFLLMRLVKLARFKKKRASYHPWSNFVRYLFFLFSTVIVIANFLIGASAKKRAEGSRTIKEFQSIVSCSFDFAPEDYRISQMVNGYILDGFSFESLIHIRDGTIKITYFECQSKIGARNYYLQFQKDNDRVRDEPSLIRTEQNSFKAADDYYAVACIKNNKVVFITCRNVNAGYDQIAAFSNQMIDSILAGKNN